MNRVKRRKLKRSADLKLLFFTFLGSFILFFLAFTWLLPVVTPQVEIPALTEDHVFNSITSHDFRGRIDPRLRSIELQEEIPPQKKSQETKETPVPVKKPANTISEEDKRTAGEKKPENIKNSIPLPGSDFTRRKAVVPVGPPRPKPRAIMQKIAVTPPAPVFKAKVIVGEFSSPKEAGMTSEILANLNFQPFIRERNGKYVLQLGSFSSTDKAKDLLKELKTRNFDAKIIYE